MGIDDSHPAFVEKRGHRRTLALFEASPPTRLRCLIDSRFRHTFAWLSCQYRWHSNNSLVSSLLEEEKQEIGVCTIVKGDPRFPETSLYWVRFGSFRSERDYRRSVT